MGYKEEFCEIFRSQISRPGAEKLLTWLEGTDFFTAPASTRFHGACEQGLVMHSLNVYRALMEQLEEGDSAESFAICALLHDLCKANFYSEGTKNQKTYDPKKVAAAEGWQWTQMVDNSATTE